MKKLLNLIVIAIFSIGFVCAQTPAAKPAKKAKKETGAKKDGTPDMRLKENKAKPAAAKPTGALKKDGTPDMRAKANKVASTVVPTPPVKPKTVAKKEPKVVPPPPAPVAKVTPTGPAARIKKDGTPDKRFKNVATGPGPKKKDGTPDMRYKVNKEAAKKN